MAVGWLLIHLARSTAALGMPCLVAALLDTLAVGSAPPEGSAKPSTRSARAAAQRQTGQRGHGITCRAAAVARNAMAGGMASEQRGGGLSSCKRLDTIIVTLLGY